MQKVADNTGDVAFVDQSCNGPNAVDANGIGLVVVTPLEACFVLLPLRWVGKCSCAWASRPGCPVRDYERDARSLAGFHLLAPVCLMHEQPALPTAFS